MLKKMKQIDDLVSEKVRDDCAKIIRLFLIFIIFLNMTAYLQKIIFVCQKADCVSYASISKKATKSDMIWRLFFIYSKFYFVKH
jgi:hypothetical protein